MSEEAVLGTEGEEPIPAKNNVTSIEPARARRARQKIELEKLLRDITLIETFDLELSAMEIIEAEGLLDRAAKLTPAHDATICEAIVKHFGSHVSEIPGLKATIKEIRQASRSLTNPKPEKVRNAKRQDFYELFEATIGPLKRDIFSECLMYRGSDGVWTAAENDIEVAMSESSVFEEEGICKFRRGDIIPHFKAYEKSKIPELLCDIPEWDKRDRVKEIAQALRLEGTQDGFTAQTVEEFMKAWLGGVFRRLENPRYQNPILIFISTEQGIGKDWLTDALTDGLGQWADHLELTGNHKDDYGQLSEALVFRIGEFDKLAQTEQAKLKDFIFRPKTGLRAAFDRKRKNRTVRCSFIASTNTHDIYKDSTGHRRFWSVNLNGIAWDYPRTAEDKAQIAAQARELGKEKYEPSEISKKLMKDYLDGMTPQSIEEQLSEHWFVVCAKWAASGADPGVLCDVTERGWITLAEARGAGIVSEVKDYHRISERYLCSKLTAFGLNRKNKHARGYAIAKPTSVTTSVTSDTYFDTSVTTSVTGIPQQSKVVIF